MSWLIWTLPPGAIQNTWTTWPTKMLKCKLEKSGEQGKQWSEYIFCLSLIQANVLCTTGHRAKEARNSIATQVTHLSNLELRSIINTGAVPSWFQRYKRSFPCNPNTHMTTADDPDIHQVVLIHSVPFRISRKLNTTSSWSSLRGGGNIKACYLTEWWRCGPLQGQLWLQILSQQEGMDKLLSVGMHGHVTLGWLWLGLGWFLWCVEFGHQCVIQTGLLQDLPLSYAKHRHKFGYGFLNFVMYCTMSNLDLGLMQIYVCTIVMPLHANQGLNWKKTLSKPCKVLKDSHSLLSLKLWMESLNLFEEKLGERKLCGKT